MCLLQGFLYVLSVWSVVLRLRKANLFAPSDVNVSAEGQKDAFKGFQIRFRMWRDF